VSTSFQSSARESINRCGSADIQWVYSIALGNTRAPRRRLRHFGASVVLHCVAVAGMWSLDVPAGHAVAAHRPYSVRLLQLQTPAEYQRHSQARSSLTPELWSHTTGQHMTAQRRVAEAPTTKAAAAAESMTKLEPLAERRPFVLPPDLIVKPVKQTLIQPDVPPDLTLTHEIPLPAAIVWTDAKLPPMRKRFIAPTETVKSLKTVQIVPENAPVTTPVREPRPSILSLAGIVPAALPKWQKTFVGPPSRGRQEATRQVSQIGVPDTSALSGGNLISLPADPVVSGTIALPPANQIAKSDVGAAGSPDGREGGIGSGGNKQQATGGIQRQTASVSADSGSGTAGKAAGNSGAAVGTAAMASAAPGNGPNGVWTASGSAAEPKPLPISGLRRIELPKNGKFGAVISGSSAAGSYPESAGALSGKVIYTVYIKVGLRKSWILQYCLPKDEKSTSGGRSSVAVEAPWPFLMMRPDQGSASDPDYMILHGTITSAGRFDQLAVIFPADFAERETVVNSLKLWEFRPAARDGVPVAVEILLIIPRQPD
jgi:hypothetical protein